MGRLSRGRAVAVVLAVVAMAAVGIGAAVLATSRPVTPTEALGAPVFVEETATAGVDHRYDGEFTFFVGGGLATFDCDDDGRPDLYLAGGAEPAGLYRNESPVGGPFRFEAVPDPATDLVGVTGAYPLDVDGDAVTDLAVLRFGENVMLRGLGGCRFERANETWGVDGGDDWTAAFSATWEGDAALPTLAFGNYVATEAIDEARDECADNVLVRPAASGDGYGAAEPLSPGWCTLSILFSDWDRSGRSDLRLTNDRHYYRDGREQLWRFEPGVAPREYTEADGWRTMHIWGMGIASRDLTGDGRPEYYLTSQADNKLQTLEQDATGPTFVDIALERGVTAHRPVVGGDVMPSTSWHAQFEDVNADGFVDLFVTKGNVEAMNEYAAIDPNDLFLGQADGTFANVTEAAGIVDPAKSRGAAVVDLDLDGRLDLVVVERREPVKLWRNTGTGGAGDGAAEEGHWLALRVRQPGPNTDAIGAWLEVRIGDLTTSRELTVGGGHASGAQGWIHVGLGPSDRAEVRITWPDGEVGPWLPVEADGFAIVERDASAVTPWKPAP